MTNVPLRRVLVSVATLVVLCIALVVLDRRGTLEPVRTGLSEILQPVTTGVGDLLDRGRPDSDLAQELATVTAERDALQAENSQLKADTAELAQLQEMQEVEDRYPDIELVPAKVLGRDPTGQQMFIRIDLGSNDGIQVGMAILSPNFYVGQVVEVSETEAKVMLIIDASQSVGAMLQDSRGEGIVTGQWQLGGYLQLDHVQNSQAPKETEWVVTSSSTVTQTRQVPPNIPIGMVMGEPVVNPQTDTLTIQVRPGIANFNTLSTVYVAVQVDE
jgi:rod shape-determining protein MreC